ncbi:MAG: VOC family protein [Pseudomonadota bacterium]
MTIGHFVWTDLSTYDMQAARSDYAAFFGWAFQGDADYDFATQHGHEVAAVCPMPARLADMNMPSFWMSYVHVENVDETVERARTHQGAVIEVEPQPFDETARIALIRDPSGAGFTVYEGPDITPLSGGHGAVQQRYHHVDDAERVRDFYADLFGWSLDRASDQTWPTFDVKHPDGSVVARLEEAPENVRGKFKYWMPCFEVDALNAFGQRVTAASGEILTDLPENRKMFADRQGAHFMARATV